MGWFASFCCFSLSPKLKLLLINMCQSSSTSSRNHLPEEPSSRQGRTAEVPWEAVLFKWLTEELQLFIPTKWFRLFEDDWAHCWAFQLSSFQVRTKGCLWSVSMQLWSHGHCGCDAGLAAIVTSKPDHLMASFAPWFWNGWLWEVHHLEELRCFFQCKKVNIPLVYKGRVIRVLRVYFLCGISRERPRVTAQMEVPTWQMAKGRWQKSTPCLALLISFLPLTLPPFLLISGGFGV